MRWLLRYLLRRELAYLLIAATGVVIGLRTHHASGSAFFGWFDGLRKALGL
jgi:hypothetical protein